jgi:ribosomal protein S18 acetylase RimI-like enzyme
VTRNGRSTVTSAVEGGREGQALEIGRDIWLANIFGRDVFKVTVPRGADGAPVFALAERGTAFYYARVPTDRIDQVRALTAAGFYLVDTALTLEQPAPSVRQWSEQPRVVVRDGRAADYDAVLRIAGSCFRYSRFHLDPHITAGVANAVKREWVRSYIHRQRGERLLVADVDGMAAGFLAVLAANEKGQAVRVIDLIGVDENCQGHGVGRALVEFFVREYGRQGQLLRVGTQSANIPSLRLYEATGFRMAASAYTLHAQVKDGKVLR